MRFCSYVLLHYFFSYFYTMAQLKLIRASAGSGKTFNLTRIFLELVLKESNSDYYRRILAVTFTNKATAEMKERILKELSVLAKGEKSEHLEYLLEKTGKTEDRIRNLSQAILDQILHGYSWFRVETIDTFFQGIIRSFVRELGIPGHYNIELDQEKILEEAVNRLLDKLDNDQKLVKWLIQYIDTRITEGKSWVVKSELQALGKSLFNEELVQNLPVLEPLIIEKDALVSYRDKLQAIVSNYQKKVSSGVKEILSKIKSLGLDDSDFYYKGSGSISYLRKLDKSPTELPGKRLEILLENPDKWAPANNPRSIEIQQLGSTFLNPSISKLIQFIEAESKEYNTAGTILKNLHILGLLAHLNSELKSLQREKGIMLISDASPFIQKIINNNDTPFIYEKAGNRFHHILIDEFQDTSSMQWGNFKPLISNSLSNNNDCLLVGDVKQSIYRWRNSNWEILAKQVKEEVSKEVIHEEPLTTNWRSSAGVISFNNAFFNYATSLFQSLMPDEVKVPAPLAEIYSDVIQEIPGFREKHEGHINIRLFNAQEVKDSPEYFGDELLERINEVLDKNYNPGDIAILVRNKKEGTTIANFLVEANKEQKFNKHVGVISNESLFLNGSPAVGLLIAALSFVYNPEDRLMAANLANAYKQVFQDNVNDKIGLITGYFEIQELTQLIDKDFIIVCKRMRMENLFSLAEKLINILDLYSLEKERVYIHSFLDVVFNYGTSELSELSGFLDFWIEEGHKKTISAAETPGSIRILTIHKSKGLEFPVVIIPFCDWHFTPKTGEKYWFGLNDEPYDFLPTNPVNFEKNLANSHFSTHFYLENYRTLIDNINLMYVAFTRAADSLIIFSRISDELKHSGDIVAHTIHHLNSINTLDEFAFDGDKNRYTIGSLGIYKDEESVNATKYFEKEEKSAELPEVRISSQAQQFMSEKGSLLDAATHGQLLHATMEKIKTADDIEPAVKQMTLNGIISNEEAEKVSVTLKNALNNPMVSAWFDESNTILSETDIIGISGNINRPDRVVISKDGVVIIDYKFGSADEADKHKKQVEKYKYLVKSMGFEHTKGYIWYVLNDNIVEV